MAITISDRFPQDTVVECILFVCCHPNPNVRTFGVLSVFRIVRANYDVGLRVVKALAGKALWHGFVCPSRLEPFAGSALGLFFEGTNNERLCADLHKITGNIITKARGVKIAKWLLPPVASAFLAKVPDDYNPMNLAEIKFWKKRSKQQKGLADKLTKCIDYMDPAVGRDEDVLETFDDIFHPNSFSVEDGFITNLVFQGVMISRILAGKELFLDVAYKYWDAIKDTGSVVGQDFAFEMRIIQLGLQQMGRTPLDDMWTSRAEETLRHFFFQQKARFRISQEYICGVLVAGFPFLARQKGSVELKLLKEFIDHAFDTEKQGNDLTASERHKRLDAILLRVIEVDAIEYGTYDAPARGLAFFGLKCFLDYIDKFDDFMWERMATVLSRMQTYFPGEVTQFFKGLPVDSSSQLQLHMNQVWPKENIGSLLSMRTEMFYAALLSEPPGKKDGFRSQWQGFLRILTSDTGLASTLRDLIGRVMDAIS